MYSSPSDENIKKKQTLPEILAAQKNLHITQIDHEKNTESTLDTVQEIPETPSLNATSTPPPFQKVPPRHKRTFWRTRLSLTLAFSLLIVLIIVLFAQFLLWPPLAPKSTLHPPVSQQTPVATPSTPATDQAVSIPPESKHPTPPVFAQAAYLLDVQSGVGLYTHNSNKHLPIMSTTKLMTALLVVEHEKNLDRNIEINQYIADDIDNRITWDSSLMGITVNEKYSVRDLLYGLLLVSGNDAAITLADVVSGNVDKFVNLMNERAQQLGLQDTHFANSSGLPDDHHYSSAHDLALIGNVSLNDPTIHAISQTRNYTISAQETHAEHNMVNGNQFLWWYPGVDSGKTGYDGEDNFVQVISVTRNNRQLIGVVIHSKDWWTDMRNLMNWGFDDFTWVSPRDHVNDDFIPYAAAWNYFADDKPETSIQTAEKGRYFIYTGYSISPPILTYFDQHGGFNKFGYPDSELTASDNNRAITQKFTQGKISCDLITKACKEA